MSFFSWYFDIESNGENAVCCPFPHSTADGSDYYEDNPSASVHDEKKVFHCMACDRGYSEVDFIKEITGCLTSDAHNLRPHFQGAESIHIWKQGASNVEYPIQAALDYGISEETQRELMITTVTGNELQYPVTMYGKMLDARTYIPDQRPKCRSRMGAVAGLIIPFDSWCTTSPTRWTLICAGEKDMSVARSQGFNAICLTGGEGTLATTPYYFKGRYVAICYDNDEAGFRGAKKLALQLVKHTPHIRVITSFHDGMEKGEDLTDYFTKYGHTKQEFITCIDTAATYVPTAEDMYSAKLGTLHDAAQPNNIGKMMLSNIQVTAVTDSVFSMPTEIIATKIRESQDPKGNQLSVGDVKSWTLNEVTLADTLHLVDSNFKLKQLTDNKKLLCKVPFGERNVSYKDFAKATVYKAVVTDLFDSQNVTTDNAPMEFICYSINHRLDSGQKYKILYKIVPHPYQGQQLIMVVYDVQQASDTVSSFKITPETINHLSAFKNLSDTMTVPQVIHHCTESVKGLLNYNGNNQLIQTIDLAYHTPLKFNLGNFKHVRGYLDTLVVGESRMGKSSTAETLRDTYGLGTFVSLAGNSATVPGLIGGSNKLGNGYQTKAGLIPQNHKGLMIFEEFGKCRSDIINELTDIRSSNEVRITRVAGSLTLPASVRMLTLSNVKSTKEIRSIASYPNGIAVVTELVGSAEDIARYDIMLVLGDKGTTISDPYWQAQEPFTKEQYQARVRWVWSRTPEQVIISEEVGKHIQACANTLNAKYDTHIKIFGTEAWKKIARLACATAGYCVSTDESYENIIVGKDHVDFAMNYYISIYDNQVFKLAEYVQHERAYTSTDDEAKRMLNEVYAMSPGTILHLEQEHKTSKQMLGAAAGVPNERLNAIINQLVQGKFVKLQNNDIIVTERYRLTLPNVNRTMLGRTEIGCL